MGTHWVRARKAISRHALDGGYRTYQPGDWFEVRNQEMRELLELGIVDTTPQILRAEYIVGDAGVLLCDGAHEPPDLAEYGLGHEPSSGTPSLPWERTVLLTKGARITTPSIVMGLSRIEPVAEDGVGWEMALLLASQTRLLRDVGSEADRARTLEALGDLRLPVYDTSVIWIRRTEATEEWLVAWSEELADGAHRAHAFVRTAYTRRLMICTLPPDWVGRWHGV